MEHIGAADVLFLAIGISVLVASVKKSKYIFLFIAIGLALGFVPFHMLPASIIPVLTPNSILFIYFFWLSCLIALVVYTIRQLTKFIFND